MGNCCKYSNDGFVEETDKDWFETTHFEYGETIEDVRADKTIYAYWDSTYTIIYMNEIKIGNQVLPISVMTQKVKYDASATAEIATASEANLTPEQGKHLAGWRYDENKYYQPGDVIGTQKLAELVGAIQNRDAANTNILNLVATWGANTYRLVFDANNGSRETYLADEEYGYNAQYMMPSTENFEEMQFTAMVGYTLKGWSTKKIAIATEIYAPLNAYSFTPDIESGEDFVLYAVWEDESQAELTLSYDANGGTGEIASQTAYIGQELTLATNTFEKENCQCIGWALEPDGQVVFEGGETLVLPYTTQNITLYAIWVELGV